jgi:hypothetical protein
MRADLRPAHLLTVIMGSSQGVLAGGHGMEPKEQNTQQSPRFGRRSLTVLLVKNQHASSGIVSCAVRHSAGRLEPIRE